MNLKLTLLVIVLFGFSTKAVGSQFDTYKLDKYLQNYYLSNKCPSGVGIKMSDLKIDGCLRSSSYFKESDAVILDYLLFKSHESIEGFSKLNRKKRELAIKEATIQLGHKVGKLKFKNRSSLNGEIQRTPVTFIVDKTSERNQSIHEWVAANSVVSLTFIFGQRWYVGFIDKDGNFAYKESFDTKTLDPVITPFDFLMN